MMGIRLRKYPCPFCGGEARLIGHFPYSVTCCKCRATTVICNTPDDAIDAWNNRVLPPFTPDELAEIRLMFDIGVRKLPDSRWVEIRKSIVEKCDTALKGGNNEKH